MCGFIPLPSLSVHQPHIMPPATSVQTQHSKSCCPDCIPAPKLVQYKPKLCTIAINNSPIVAQRWQDNKPAYQKHKIRAQNCSKSAPISPQNPSHFIYKTRNIAAAKKEKRRK